MLSTFLPPQRHRPRRHLASGATFMTVLALGFSILLAGCVNDDRNGSDQSSSATLSSNADLASLTLSEGTLSPAFSPTTLSYSASVPGSVNTLQVTPTPVDDKASVQVNGATVASGAPSDPIALQVGVNILTIVVMAEDGKTSQTFTVEVTRLSDQTVGMGPTFSSPRGIALDDVNSRILVVDAIPPTLAAVMTVDSGTGDRATLSDHNAGAGPNFRFPRGVVFDSAHNRALVVDTIPPLLAAVVAVDLSTGDRAILSDDATGMGPNISSPLGIALDSANNRALVVDSSLAAVVAVDLNTGDRAILSDNATGIGPNILSPRGIVVDSANNRVLVVDSSLAAVVAVDLSTGDRAVLSATGAGMGSDFSYPVGITLDSANDRAFVVDSSLAAVVAVDLNTGDRAIFSDASTGAGPDFSFPVGIALDSANDRILVMDSSQAAVIAVDLSSGNRSIQAK